MDKELIVHTKMGADKLTENTQIPQDLSAQIVCPSQKVWECHEKRLHWASVVHAYKQSTQIFSSSVVLSSWGLLLKNKWQEFFLPKNCCFHDNGGVTKH